MRWAALAVVVSLLACGRSAPFSLASLRDAGSPGGGTDAGRFDAGVTDAGAVDAAVPDAGVDAGADAGVPDASIPDAGVDAGSPDAGVDAGTPDACVLTTCAALGANCGTLPDGCGGQLSCGTCQGAETCGGAGLPNVCGAIVPVPAQVGGGSGFTCAISPTHGLQCWGANTQGQLGDGTNVLHLTPAPVPGESAATAVAVGMTHACALSDGGVACWGGNVFGQLGDGTLAPKAQPTAVPGLQSGVASITAGAIHTCALTQTGGAKCWGANNNGELGNGLTGFQNVPTDVSGLSQGVIALSAGGTHTCALVAGGTVKCWGSNVFGQLGDGTKTTQRTPVDVVGLSGVVAISGGAAYTCALLSGGAVKCWGSNIGGELGIGMLGGESLVPVDVLGLDGGVTALMPSANFHMCVTTTGGALKCWGDNEGGQLGDGTKVLAGSPVAVIGLSAGVRAAAAAGAYQGHTCAVLVDGGLECWGQNSSGQLGDGTTTEHLTPAPVVGF